MTLSHDGEAGAYALRPGRDALVTGQVERVQRARMIAAMVRVVSRHGLANATVGRVVADSGVSRRTFYEVFEDGHDCFLVALQASVSAASQRVLGAYDPSAAWRIRVRAALTAFLEFLDDEPDMAKLLLVESLGAGPRALAYRADALVPLIAEVDESQKEMKGRLGGVAHSPLTAEGVVGAVLSVLHTRLVGHDRTELTSSPSPETGSTHMTSLTSQLMSIIVLPYLGPAAARRELAQPAPEHKAPIPRSKGTENFKDFPMRVTHRTMCVIWAIASSPGLSNRQIANAAGVSDMGQISKLLSRLEQRGLLANDGAGQAKGGPNAWTLTSEGERVVQVLSLPASASP